VFAWSYKDMPGIDQDVEDHKTPLYPNVKPIKQKLYTMKLEWALKLKEKV